MEHIAIARFKPGDAHGALADLSERCHRAAAQGDAATLAGLQADIDGAAARLWGITGPELAAIQRALDAMRKSKGAVVEDEAKQEEEEASPLQ